jgi:hypothetical protein
LVFRSKGNRSRGKLRGDRYVLNSRNGSRRFFWFGGCSFRNGLFNRRLFHHDFHLIDLGRIGGRIPKVSDSNRHSQTMSRKRAKHTTQQKEFECLLLFTTLVQEAIKGVHGVNGDEE